MEKIRTDVLIIGGGLAGLLAALEARKKGLEVIIVSKSKVGRSGNTLVANANISALTADEADGSKHQVFYKDLLSSGKGINDIKMVEKFVEEADEIVNTLENYGVSLKKTGTFPKKLRVPGHSEARTIYAETQGISYHNRGLAITLPLLRKIKETGIKIMENLPVVKILTWDQQVCGVVAIDKKAGKPLIFQTAQVILACGGGGNIFSNTNNTRDITGDSYSLAFEAGAQLRDMEFVQFYPTMMYSPVKLAIANTLFGEGAVLRNKHKEEFMTNYDRAGNMATRDVMARAIFTEVMAGHGVNGGVYMDCTTIPENVLKSKYKRYFEYLKRTGVDLTQEFIVVSPGTHFFMGGVEINEQGETSLAGLFACGEAVGGLHGANRLGGNALAEAIVFGKLAGKNVHKVRTVPPLPPFELEPVQVGNLKAAELKSQVRNIMWESGSIIRSGETLEKAKEKIQEINKLTKKVTIRNFNDYVDFSELKSIIITSRLILEGAILRKESRGAHYRMDFPSEDNNTFKGNFIYKKENGDVDVKFQR